MRAALPFMLLLALVPTTASAVTLQEIVALSKAGVSEQVLLALIDRDKNIFTIEPEQLVALKRDGVSDAVVLAMLRSGRQPAETQAGRDTGRTAPALPPAPETIIVGHGPDRPNTYHSFDDFVAPAYVASPFVIPVVPGLPTGASRIPPRPNRTGQFGRFMSDPTARFLNDPSRRFLNSGFIPAGTIVDPSSATVDCFQPAPPAYHRLRR